ncbi:glycoside hydrolase family 76 protein [Lepidopterella palustris CBS 459.81]|uniref:Mannan endo-1,6-alpha-mannosidase n=1 Tax=Lepidopterella palustris CBS 459.81 TaxID=1314670 RepID=A0A8E2JJX6_9PEZI|nr:glycoside hydrolase family 76 protein [Lepidopterella palustris CBS 459.81]
MLSPVFCFLTTVPLCLHHGIFINAIELDISQPDSIKAAASITAYGMMKYYQGNLTGQIPGLLPGPYYWWEAGAMFGQMVDYWYYTQDDTYNNVVCDALLFQVGPDRDYMPPNQTKDEGNDDQVFWAFAALSAAENNFPNPLPPQPQWLALAQAVFNRQVSRWDKDFCGGGLRWQIYSFNNGYDYKNSISNGGFFLLAARLARYTGNQTYADWAEKMYDWCAQSPLLSADYHVYDGSSVSNNCSDADHHIWSYNYGVFIAGAAYMYNYTNGSTIWHDRVLGFTKTALANFFPISLGGGNIMIEIGCEVEGTCNVDQPSFKAYLARWFAITTQLAPFTYSLIMPKLRASAQGAAKQCSGGTDGVTCGRHWYQDTWDGTYGVGEQMSAMSVISAMMLDVAPPPLSIATGGSSKGDPNAGTGSAKTLSPDGRPITATDKIGAGVMTVALLLFMIGGAWLILD